MSKSKESDGVLESAKISLVREIGLATTSNLGGTIASFLQTVVLAMFLSLAQVGEFFIYLAIVYTVSQVFKGIGNAIRKRASSVDVNRSRYFYSSFLFLGAILPLLLIIGFFGPSISQFTNFAVTKTAVYATIFATVAKGTNTFSLRYLSGVGKPGLAESIRNYIVKIGQLVTLFIGLSLSATVPSALVWYGIASLIGSFVSLYFAPTQFIRPDKETVMEIYRFAKWSVPNSLLNDFYLRLDTLALGFFVTSTAAGWYDVSVRVALFSFILAGGVSKTVAVKFSGMYESGIDFSEELQWALRVSTYLIYPSIVVFFLHGEAILTYIYNPEYAGAYWYLIGILVYLVLQAYRMISESVFNALDQPETITVASLSAVIVNIVVIYPLIIQFGGIGVVYSTLIAELFRAVYFGVKLQEYLYIDHRMLYQPLISGFLLIVLNSILLPMVSVSPLLQIILTLSVLFAFYLIPLGYLNIEDQPNTI